MKGLWTAFAGTVAIAPAAVRASTPLARAGAAVAKEPARISTSQQWKKLSGILTTAIDTSHRARDLQSNAAQQLDLATYALYNLMDELSAVMSEPVGREAASVHRLPSKPRVQYGEALAA